VITQAELDEYSALLEEEDHYRRTHILHDYVPYPKQREWMNLSGTARECGFISGNQLGKTMCGAMAVSIHLTGQYPDWWKGRRFDEPTRWWVAGESGESTRDSVQKYLLGEFGEFGTGAIPGDCIDTENTRMSKSASNLVDFVRIKHVKGWSHLSFKTYGKSRERWQSETLHGVWFDEEPPLDVYAEGMTRTNVKRGLVLLTFTPLKGFSDVVMRFWAPDSKDRSAKYRNMVRMEINDVPDAPVGHYSAEDKRAIIDAYLPWEREARASGMPYVGSGRIFDHEESRIGCPPFEIPSHYAKIAGFDFGWGDHPTAAAWLALDTQSDTVYVYDQYVSKDTGIAVHASALRSRGANIPVAWPHDGLQKDKGSGIGIANLYRAEGAALLSEHARFVDKSNGLEAGIAAMYQRMSTGRLRVFYNVTQFFAEMRLYHRDGGVIVARNDDFLSAVRYGVMMLRYATPEEVLNPKEDRYSRRRRRAGNVTWMSA